jgi:hypothetical protein
LQSSSTNGAPVDAGPEGYRPSEKKAKKVLAMHRDGLSYRLIGRNLGLSQKHRDGDR